MLYRNVPILTEICNVKHVVQSLLESIWDGSLECIQYIMFRVMHVRRIRLPCSLAS